MKDNCTSRNKTDATSYSKAKLFFALLLSCVTICRGGFAQILETRISVNMKQVPLEAVLKYIESKAQVRIFYSVDQLGFSHDVSVHAENATVRSVLDEIFKDHQVAYQVDENKRIIILKRQTARSAPSRRSGEIPNSNNLSQGLITGVITDAASGQPMPGVNIIVRGTIRGTTSGSDGKFAISAEQNEVLVFSFIGYKTTEVKLSGSTDLILEMEADIMSLAAVEVNAGYYRVSREEQTGNITRVNAEEIDGQPVSNPLATLGGRVAGLEVIQNTGVPGGNFKVRIRGQNSIGSGNDPLYIINGVPFISTSQSFLETSSGILPAGTNPLNSINPSDIESIEVLKDADATSIYGSRGANGVILITTKKGKEGRTNVSLNLYTGIGMVARQADLLTSDQYLTMRREAYRNDGIDFTQPSVHAPDLKVWDTTRYTNWQEELIGGRAAYRNADISISGGEGKTQYLLGGSFHSEGAVFPGNNHDRRFSLHSNLSTSAPDEKFSGIFTINFTRNDAALIRRDLAGLALTLPPVAPPLFDDEGDLNWSASAWNGSGSLAHPLSATRQSYESITNTFVANSVLSYTFSDLFELKTNLGMSSAHMQSVMATPISSLDPATPNPMNAASFASNNFSNWIAEPQLNYRSKLFGQGLEIIVGGSFLSQRNEGGAQFANGFPSEALIRDINSAGTILRGTSLFNAYRYVKGFSRINVNVRERYIFNLTASRDGSSRFGPGNRFANFGAIGVAWIFSQESFLKHSNILSFGKLRATAGLTGNDQIGDYQFLDTYAPAGSGAYQGISGIGPQRPFNADFGWETTTKKEAGLELGFFGGRITSSLVYYHNTSGNQLIGEPLPLSTGFSSVQNNFPAVVRNSGLEIVASASPVNNDAIGWTVSANFSLPKNELVSFPRLEQSSYASSLVVGEPVSVTKRFRYLGVDAATGMYTFEDVNGDGVFNATDRTSVAFVGPKAFGGLSNTFSWRGLEFSFLVQYVNQSGPDPVLTASSLQPGREFNAFQQVWGRWRSEGDPGDIQRFSTQSQYQQAFTRLASSDKAVVDASFVRIKNIGLSYSFPRQFIQRIRIEKVRLYFQAQNVFTITSYEGLDPETLNTSLPPLTVLTTGLQITL
ncbi:MAG TPA: SusC/RagA family TonB-linked outer membrane protein [Chryseosolibacter sp.]